MLFVFIFIVINSTSIFICKEGKICSIFSSPAIHHHHRRRHIYASRRRAARKAIVWNTDTQKQYSRIKQKKKDRYFAIIKTEVSALTSSVTFQRRDVVRCELVLDVVGCELVYLFTVIYI